MVVFYVIVKILPYVFGVLALILFFKIWGLCDDVRALRQKYAPKQEGQLETKGKIDKWLDEEIGSRKKESNEAIENKQG